MVYGNHTSGRALTAGAALSLHAIPPSDIEALRYERSTAMRISMAAVQFWGYKEQAGDSGYSISNVFFESAQIAAVCDGRHL